MVLSVAQSLLSNSEQHQLGTGIQAPGLTVNVAAHVDLRSLPQFVDESPQRWHESEVEFLAFITASTSEAREQ
jgi:hypothetical protein